MTWYGGSPDDTKWYRFVGILLIVTLLLITPRSGLWGGFFAGALEPLFYLCLVFLLIGVVLLWRWTRIWRLPSRRQGVVRLEEGRGASPEDGTSDERP